MVPIGPTNLPSARDWSAQNLQFGCFGETHAVTESPPAADRVRSKRMPAVSLT